MIQMSKEAQEIKVKEIFRKDHIFSYLNAEINVNMPIT